MAYFNSKNRKIENFPKDFQHYYQNYRQTGEPWQLLDSSKAVCFKFWEMFPYGVPPFSGIFEDIIELDELKDEVKLSLKLENFKLLLQKIPYKKDPKNAEDFLLTLDTVRMFHKSIASNLPSGVNLVSSPMEVDDISFERKQDESKENVDFIKNNFYDNSGVSEAAFNAAR